MVVLQAPKLYSLNFQQNHVSFRASQDLHYLQRYPAGFADLADVFLVAEKARSRAHSQLLASQSCFIRELLTATGGRNPWSLTQLYVTIQ